MHRPAPSGENQKPAGAPDVLVIGGGRFGRLAARRLGRRVLAVVEPDPAPELREMGVTILLEDGPAAAFRFLESPNPPAWIAPCLPRHLLWEWLRLELAALDPRPWPLAPSVPPPVPSVMAADHGGYYLSLAESLCPDDCPEPAGICSVTGQPRGEPMFRRLEEIQLAGAGVGVVRSRQLAPGVGGLKTDDMLQLRKAMARAGGVWIVASACRCHGVIHGLELNSPTKEGYGVLVP